MGTAFLAGQSGSDKSIKHGMIISEGATTEAVAAYQSSTDLITVTGKGFLKFIGIASQTSSVCMVAEVSIDGQEYYVVGNDESSSTQKAGIGAALAGTQAIVEVEFKTGFKIRGKVSSNNTSNSIKAVAGWIGV